MKEDRSLTWVQERASWSPHVSWIAAVGLVGLMLGLSFPFADGQQAGDVEAASTNGVGFVPFNCETDNDCRHVECGGTPVIDSARCMVGK
jgi:hypothetical protein